MCAAFTDEITFPKIEDINVDQQNWDILYKKIMKFNIGGRKFECIEDILLPIKDSLLGRCLYDDNMLYKDSEGYFFFDSNGYLFEYILEYLRNKKLVWPKNSIAKEKLKKELEFFGISEELFSS